MHEEILSVQQRRRWDTFTIKQGGISSLVLMEEASRAFVHLFKERITPTATIHILVGIGNNGGDGLVIARLLHAHGYKVRIYAVGDKSCASPDCLAQWKKNEALSLPTTVVTVRTVFALTDGDVVIDALFGTGLSRALHGLAAQVVQAVCATGTFRVSVDIPSGLFADKSSKGGTVFSADWVITFQTPPLAFFMPENACWVKEWSVTDIGLHTTYPSTVVTPNKWLLEEKIANFLPVRPTFFHKGMAGRGLLIAGSKGMMGAALLAARGSLLAGLGMLHVHVPKGCAHIVHTSLPEAMVYEDEHPHFFTYCEATCSNMNAIALGPGLGQHFPTAAALKHLLRTYQGPLVLDADALNILSTYPELLLDVPKDAILTPHPGEFRRLVGDWQDDFERIEKLRAFSKKHHLTMVLKGAYTSIATPEGTVWFNTTGNAGMSTAGAGDVLTGVILGFLVQGILPWQAALLAVWIHGKAGDRAQHSKGTHALLASDIISHLPDALRAIESENGS